MSACDILVIANLNMDLILEQKNSQQTSRKRYADSFTLSPGGNGYNEAVAAARMGATVALAGMIGSDSFGAQLKASLNEEITDSQLVRVVPGSSGLSLILSSAGQENIYWDIVGANACLDEEYIRGLESHIAKVKLLVVGFGVPYASTVLAIRLAQKHGTAVMLVAYQSRPLSDELLSMVDILVLDSREALPLADMEVTNLKSARIAAGMLLKRGVRQAVLLHMKSRFLLAATNGGFTSLEAPKDFHMTDASAMDDTLSGVFGACWIKGLDVEQAAEIAQATEFISAKPEGFDSPIAQGGSNVSGGQKQRLSIARAIAKHPQIYLFDDSFSALDYKTDVALRRALKAKTDNATVIIVAQRISTVLHANQILVLDEGRIVGKGTHAQLMESCPAYQEIARSQLSQKELNLQKEGE